MMETLKDLQLEHLMVPMVRAVLDLVVLIMVAKTVDVPVALGAPALPTPVLATMLDVAAAAVAEPVESSGKAAAALAMAPMASVEFAVSVATGGTRAA